MLPEHGYAVLDQPVYGLPLKNDPASVVTPCEVCDDMPQSTL
jgi:hypothetical protein